MRVVACSAITSPSDTLIALRATGLTKAADSNELADSCIAGIVAFLLSVDEVVIWSARGAVKIL